ncbi:hypothetical protein EDC22_108150 [Tepidamorphus gemmatus]|uniref:Uncharacterized protein n=1 Tax=Tepidamorphus gemmatus TaxID=747076 RepID=A0A4R3M733_9HYPH|nr:hypothetical protein [Tepidamorphus gemmatus]TCT08836.1 hypothetical protein EDC22_108150 [Tepidamorphus gemmatus]
MLGAVAIRELERVYDLHPHVVCGGIGQRMVVMQTGDIVERLDVEAMRRPEARHPYTRHLLEASTGLALEKRRAPV